MKDLPPPSYRVVERGRRLEVIDVARGEPIRSTLPTGRSGMRDAGAGAGAGAIASLLPRKLSFDGTAELRTARLYDAKAPRTVLLVPANATRVRVAIAASLSCLLLFAGAALVWPLLLTGPLLVHVLGIGPLLRKRATIWLDRVEAAVD